MYRLTTTVPFIRCLFCLLFLAAAGRREAHEDFEGVVDHPLQAGLLTLALLMFD